MKLLLNLNGWKKNEDIPDYIALKGRVETVLYPPMTTLISKRDMIIKDNAIKVAFLYNGKKENGLPIFEY